MATWNRFMITVMVHVEELVLKHQALGVGIHSAQDRVMITVLVCFTE